MKKLLSWTALWMLVFGLSPLGQNQQSSVNFLGDNKDGSTGYVEVKGIGVPPAGMGPTSALAYANARRAAQLVLYRAIAEAVSTIHLDSETQVSNFQTLMDQINSRVQADIKLDRAQLVSETSMTDFVTGEVGKRGIIEIVMRVPLTGTGGVYTTLMPALQPTFVKRDALLVTFEASAAPPVSRPQPVEPAYDGLIVRVPTGFQPTPGPRIFSDDGKIVYSPKNIALDILNNRGAAQYTNNEDKAKNALKRLGANSPLMMNGSMRTDTDAQLKNEDASKVYNANKRNPFLNNARVVFLIAS